MSGHKGVLAFDQSKREWTHSKEYTILHRLVSILLTINDTSQIKFYTFIKVGWKRNLNLISFVFCQILNPI